MNEKNEELIKKIDTRLERVEEQMAQTATKTEAVVTDVEILKRKVDEFEQRERGCNMIITGKIIKEITTKGMVELLNENIGSNLQEEDVRYVLKLGKGDEKRRVIMVFRAETVRNGIMSQGKKLKGIDLWMTDDMTQYRSNLAFQVRQAVKSRFIAQTWVTDCKVFIKEKEDGPSKRITQRGQIPSAKAE